MYWIDPRRSWSPFAELRSLQREMNRLFDGYDGGTAISRFPAINVWGNNEQVVVSAELPGLEIDDLDISVMNNQLTIQGERKGDKPADDAVCHQTERNTGRFLRTLKLPYTVDSEKVQAKYDLGVLTIMLPRHEANKPKKIEIKAS